MSRARARHHWLRIAQKRRRQFLDAWGPMSREYVAGRSLNEHATDSLGHLCSCEMCQPQDPRKYRHAQNREWKKQEGLI